MGNIFCKKEEQEENYIPNDTKGIQRHSEYKNKKLNVVHFKTEEMEKYTWLPII